jgi:alpha-tubulin suppressor-like RCC1 family protein
MGLNDWGQVGDGTHNWIYQAKQIVSSNVTAVAGGYSGSIFLKNDGSLWAMGINWNSDYGAGIEFHSDWPVQIAAGNSAHSAPLVAGYYYDAALKTTASLWAKSFNNYNQPSGGTTGSIVKSGLTETNPPSYNLISIELMNDGNVRLTYLGNASATYALDRSFSLTTPNWLPQVTNSTDMKGVLIITNSPDPTKNNFWRIRSVP